MMGMGKFPEWDKALPCGPWGLEARSLGSEFLNVFDVSYGGPQQVTDDFEYETLNNGLDLAAAVALAEMRNSLPGLQAFHKLLVAFLQDVIEKTKPSHHQRNGFYVSTCPACRHTAGLSTDGRHQYLDHASDCYRVAAEKLLKKLEGKS